MTRLDFLGSWLFSFENPDSGGWIFLDFLGFSRPNLDLSVGYAAKNDQTFFVSLLSVSSAPPEWEHAVEAMRKRRRSMGQLNLFSDCPEEIVDSYKR
jgi:hypothetical protein